MTLTEVLVTVTLAAIIVIAFTRGIVGALQGGVSARTTTQATALARSALESARGIGWGALAHLQGSVAGDPRVVDGMFDPDGPNGPLPPEPLIESDSGALGSHSRTETLGPVAYTVDTFVTDAGDGTKRVTAIVVWNEGRRERETTLATLVPAGGSGTGAAALVFSGTATGTALGDVGSVDADAGGGSSSDGAGSFSLPPGGPAIVTGTGGSASARVEPGPAAHAAASFSTMQIALPGVTIAASGVVVSADSLPGSMSVAASGSVTINGIGYSDPAPGTRISLAGFRIVLNDQRREADGSMSVTFIRVTGTGTDVKAGWAWVRPVEFLHV